MHLVFLNQYYPPDAAPTGVMLEAVAEHLVQQGHEVTVLCASGGYAGGRHKTARHKTQDGRGEAGERGQGEVDRKSDVEAQSTTDNGQGTEDRAPRTIRIGATRFGRGSVVGKLLDYLSYYVGVAWKLGTMRPAPDRIVALTTPPYLSVLARLMSKIRGGTHGHWVMDLYPDVMVAHGMLADGGMLHRLLAWLARWGMGGKRCAVVLTLGPCMADRLRRSLKLEASEFALHPLHHVPLWSGAESPVDDTEVESLRTARGWADDEVVVMYSGNMGLGHRFTELFDAIKELSKSAPGKFRFVFFGKGRRRVEVEAFLRDNPRLPVELHDYVAEELLGVHLRSADIHVVSLDPAWSGTMLPSKLQGVFAAGRSVIYIGGNDSSMAQWIRESGAGWVVEAHEVDGLRQALQASMDESSRLRMGAAALKFASLHFDQKKNVVEVAGKLTRI